MNPLLATLTLLMVSCAPVSQIPTPKPPKTPRHTVEVRLLTGQVFCFPKALHHTGPTGELVIMADNLGVHRLATFPASTITYALENKDCHETQ